MKKHVECSKNIRFGLKITVLVTKNMTEDDQGLLKRPGFGIVLVSLFSI